MRTRLSVGVLFLLVCVSATSVLAQKSRCEQEMLALVRAPWTPGESLASYFNAMQTYRARSSAAELKSASLMNMNELRKAREYQDTLDDLDLLDPVIVTSEASRKAVAQLRKRLIAKRDDAVHNAQLLAKFVDDEIGRLCGVQHAPPLVAQPQHQPPPVEQPRPKPRPRNAFTLADAKVENTHPKELTIDADGHTGHFDNTGQGGATWQADYSWSVPDTIVPGQPFSVMIRDHILDIRPRQSTTDAISFSAPDNGKQLTARFPEDPDASGTYEVRLSEDYRNASEIVVSIWFMSSHVSYVYKHN